MRRADRLFRIVQLLRSGRLQTARHLAEKLQVSHRTIYRDVQDLQLSGVPITGEAGVGYTLRRDFDIPPLMFDREEITALVLGARMVQAWGGTQLTEAANRSARTDRRGPALCAWLSRFARASLQARHTSCRRPAAARRPHRLFPRRRATERAPRPPSGSLLLGRHMDTRRMVRAKKRFPQLPRRPHGTSGKSDRDIPAKARTATGRFSQASTHRTERTTYLKINLRLDHFIWCRAITLERTSF